jgi:dihydroorotate dehydrogenase
LGVWYGLKNAGVEILFKKLSQKIHRLPIGVNVAFTNCKENSDISLAITDYVTGFKKMEPLADYMTVNLSCPNTSGGMPFLVPENYDRLMIEIDEIKTIKPVFVKINPDMSHEEIDMFLEISGRHRVHGIICSNLTKKVKQENIKDPLPPHGGLSGKLIYPKALDLLSYMYKKTGNKFIYIFSGGIFSAEDAYEVMSHGASLIELITSMIYEGPQVISEINRGLVEKINSGGFKNLSEIIGIENRQK